MNALWHHVKTAYKIIVWIFYETFYKTLYNVKCRKGTAKSGTHERTSHLVLTGDILWNFAVNWWCTCIRLYFEMLIVSDASSATKQYKRSYRFKKRCAYIYCRFISHFTHNIHVVSFRWVQRYRRTIMVIETLFRWSLLQQFWSFVTVYGMICSDGMARMQGCNVRSNCELWHTFERAPQEAVNKGSKM